MHFNNPTSGQPRHYSKSYGRIGGGSNRILTGTRFQTTRRLPPILSNNSSNSNRQLSPRHAPYNDIVRALPSLSPSNASTSDTESLPSYSSVIKTPIPTEPLHFGSSVQSTMFNLSSASKSTPVRTKHEIRPPTIRSKCELRSPMNNSAADNEIYSMSSGEISSTPWIRNSEYNAPYNNLANLAARSTPGGRVYSLKTRPSHPMIVSRGSEEKENESTVGNTPNERYRSYALEARPVRNSQRSGSMSSSSFSLDDHANSGTVG